MKENTIGIIGKANTGKTRKILFKEINEEIEKNNNLLILDGKTEYYNHFRDELIQKGYTIKVINFKNPLRSDGYDILEYVEYLYNHGEIDHCIEEIRKIGIYLFKSNFKDSFWIDTVIDYFVGLVLILLKNQTPGSLNFGSILNIINDAEKKYKDSTILQTYCDTLSPMDPIYMAISSTVYAPQETKNTILSILKQRLNLYFMRPNLLNSFHNAYFHVPHLSDHTKLAIFIINYEPLDKLTNILIEQAYDIAKENNNYFTFILDGLDELPEIYSIEEMINYANSGKMKIYATTKNFDRLAIEYKRYAFSNVERKVVTEELYESDYEDVVAVLPSIHNHSPHYFEFEKFVKDNCK